jgi:hypothetical protein
MERLTKPVRLYCDGGTIGTGWCATIEFRPLVSGFSVWESDPDNGRLHCITKSSAPLMWRRIAECLTGRGWNGLQGADLLRSIDVSNVEQWQADILRMCWITHDEDREITSQREFLLSLPDAEIRQLWSEEHTLVSDDVLGRLGELVSQMEECGLQGLTLTELVNRVGINTSYSSVDLVRVLEEIQEKVLTKYSQDIEKMIAKYRDDHPLQAPYSVTDARAHYEKEMALRRYIERWVIKHGVLPENF